MDITKDILKDFEDYLSSTTPAQDSLDIDKMDVPLHIALGSRQEFDFEITSKKENSEFLLYNRNQKIKFPLNDPKNFGAFDCSRSKLLENVENNLKNEVLEDFEKELETISLKKLQDEFIEDAKHFIHDDFKLSRPNTITTNFTFDVLTGELKEAVHSTIDISFKNFSMDSGHHEQPKKGPNTKSRKIKRTYEARELEGNSELKNYEDIEKELTKYSKTVENALSEELIQLIDIKDPNKVINSAADILDSLNLVSYDPENKDTKQIDDKNRYDRLWTAISEQFPKPKKEEKPETDSEEEQEVKNEEEEEEELKLELALETADPIMKKESSGVKDEFERALTDNTVKIVKLQEKVQPTITTGTQYRFAVQDNADLSNFYEQLPKSKFAMQYSFELDDFQKRAILHLENKESVFVAAHTSAGKTVVAEYAIALARNHMTRAIYTSPIKALSNQKYRDFQTKFESVGILTGDVSLNPEASCLIVTTEVLRSMLYKGSDMIRDIEWVIFDEVHYVNNAERGVVWEETIIMLPPHIGIIMLSATVPNAMEFANWVGMTKRRKIFVQTTYKRPTPLEHSICVNGKYLVIKDKNGSFMQDKYEEFKRNTDLSKKKQDELRETRKADLKEKFEEKDWDFKDRKKKDFLMRKNLTKVAQGIEVNNLTSKGNRQNQDKGKIYDMIKHCEKEKLLPCVFFAFSKKNCMELAFGLTGLNLCTPQESKRISHFYQKSIKRLKPVDRELPQIVGLKDILKRGIAVHHGDLLPICKEIVEILFSEGLIKVLFATETFAMGVNMPAKSVVFCGLKKSDGKDFRNLKSVY